MKRIVSIVVALVAVAILVGLLMPTLAWNGATTVQFRFHVVESSTSRAIKDARIRVLRNSELSSLSETNGGVILPSATTDAAGSASVSVMCGAAGGTGLFGKTGQFDISHGLLVEAEGYRPLSNGLANVVGGRRWPLSKRVFDVELFLTKNR